MKSVLLIAHGSRKSIAEEEFYSILHMVQKRIPSIRVEGAFMSCNDTTIEQKLEELTKDGATEIEIIPYFLFSGNHVKNSIPFRVEKFLHGQPGIKVSYKSALGIDQRLAEIVVDRINDETIGDKSWDFN